MGGFDPMEAARRHLEMRRRYIQRMRDLMSAEASVPPTQIEQPHALRGKLLPVSGASSEGDVHSEGLGGAVP